MQLGLGTYALAWNLGVPGFTVENPLSAVDILEIAHEQGVRFVQIADNVPLCEYNEDQLQEIKHKANELSIRLEIGARGLIPENLQRYLELSSFFDSDILRIVIDSGNFEPSLSEIVQILKDFSSELLKRKIRLAIENHDRLSVYEFVTILDKINDTNVGICLDTVNSFGKGEGLETAIKALAPYTINLHIKDFYIKRLAHNMGFEISGTPAGKGMLPIPQLISQLNQYGKCNSGILELWPSPENDMDTTCRKEIRWVNESIDFLKNYLTI